MLAIKIILGIIGYLLIACVAAWLFNRVICKDDAVWTGLLWPITGPFAILAAILMGIHFGIKWFCTWMDKFVQEKFGW